MITIMYIVNNQQLHNTYIIILMTKIKEHNNSNVVNNYKR